MEALVSFFICLMTVKQSPRMSLFFTKPMYSCSVEGTTAICCVCVCVFIHYIKFEDAVEGMFGSCYRISLI